MRYLVENLETDVVVQADLTEETMTVEVSRILGYSVVCLDESKGWLYFWKREANSDSMDAVCIARPA